MGGEFDRFRLLWAAALFLSQISHPGAWYTHIWLMDWGKRKPRTGTAHDLNRINPQQDPHQIGQVEGRFAEGRLGCRGCWFLLSLLWFWETTSRDVEPDQSSYSLTCGGFFRHETDTLWLVTDATSPLLSFFFSSSSSELDARRPAF